MRFGTPAVNPFHGNAALKRRAMVTAIVDLVMLDDRIDRDPTLRRAATNAYWLAALAATYADCHDVLPPRKLFGEWRNPLNPCGARYGKVRDEDIRGTTWARRQRHDFNPVAFSPGHDFYRPGGWSRLRRLQDSDSPLLRSPFLRDENFVRRFGDRFVVAKQEGYAAILHDRFARRLSPIPRAHPADRRSRHRSHGRQARGCGRGGASDGLRRRATLRFLDARDRDDGKTGAVSGEGTVAYNVTPVGPRRNGG